MVNYKLRGLAYHMRGTYHQAEKSIVQGFSTGGNPLGVNFTYPGGKFDDAEVTVLCFFLQR